MDDNLFSFYLRDDATRPPDWRWQNIRSILGDQRCPCPERDDADVLEALQFFQRFKRSRSTRRKDRRQPFDDPIEARFFALDQTEQRFEVQARLLAGQELTTIADRCDLPSGMIRWFASLFFDVQDRLACRDWIERDVIGRDGSAGGDPSGIGRALMVLAYDGGSRVLDVTLAVHRHCQLPKWVADCADGDPDVHEVRLALLARLSLLLMTAPGNARAIQCVHGDLVRLDGIAADDQGRDVHQAMRAFRAGELTRPYTARVSSPPAWFQPLDLAAAEREMRSISSTRDK